MISIIGETTPIQLRFRIITQASSSQERGYISMATALVALMEMEMRGIMSRKGTRSREDRCRSSSGMSVM
jgi:hypothetical protein